MQRLRQTTLGAVRRQRTLGSVKITATDYAAGVRLSQHEHTDAYLCLIARGGYWQSASGHTSECAQGLLLVHPEGHRHANRFAASDTRCLNIHLEHTCRDDHLEHTCRDDPSIRRLLGDFRLLRIPDAVRLRHRIEHELDATDAAAGLALQSAILELLAQACRLAEPHPWREPEWLVRVHERLHDDHRNVPTLGELALLAGVHPAHLARSFHRVHGMSVGEYQRRLRIEHAGQDLIATDRPIAAIAADSGFSDQSHFTRVFRRITGETPHSWRQRTQNRY